MLLLSSSMMRYSELCFFFLFFFHAVGSLKLRGLQLVHSNRHGGGALGAQMNLFDRFARVVKVGLLFHKFFNYFCFDNLSHNDCG